MKYVRGFLKWSIILFVGGSLLSVIAFKYLPVPVTPLMLIRVAQQLKDGREVKLVHHWVPMDSISSSLPQAVWASEDQLFLQHHGFDFKQIGEAVKERNSGHRQRGASTISQQTAKNVFLWPTSSWVRKGFEVWFTVLIEVFWDKQRIMEVYLNSIEMGDGIYGAEAVAHEHFGCSALQLSRQQCALIAVSLPNPIRFDSSSPSNYMYRRQRWVLRQMRQLGPFPMEEESEE